MTPDYYYHYTKYFHYIGLFLALLGSNLCGLLLVLNALSWTNLLHADLQALEGWVETTLSPYHEDLQQATVMCVIGMTLVDRAVDAYYAEFDIKDPESKPEEPRTHDSPYRPMFSLRQLSSIMLVLILPAFLEPYKHSHPIIRRSLISMPPASSSIVDVGGGNDIPQQATPQKQEELVFEVQQMTCGGCGSHVRDLVESTLNKQPQGTPFQIEKVDVDWRAGVLSVYGMNVVEGVSKDAIQKVLSEDGYPTKFLYAN